MFWSNEYWICGQNSGGNMQYVNMKKYRHDSDNQTTEKYVRCVCDVDDNVPEGTTVYPQTGVGKLLKGAHTAEKITDVPDCCSYFGSISLFFLFG